MICFICKWTRNVSVGNCWALNVVALIRCYWIFFVRESRPQWCGDSGLPAPLREGGKLRDCHRLRTGSGHYCLGPANELAHYSWVRRRRFSGASEYTRRPKLGHVADSRVFKLLSRLLSVGGALRSHSQDCLVRYYDLLETMQLLALWRTNLYLGDHVWIIILKSNLMLLSLEIIMAKMS